MTDGGHVAASMARWQRLSLFVGLAGAVVLLVGAFIDAQQFFRSYLFAWLFVWGLGLGSLGVVMLHHMTGGAWRPPGRRERALVPRLARSG